MCQSCIAAHRVFWLPFIDHAKDFRLLGDVPRPKEEGDADGAAGARAKRVESVDATFEHFH